MNVLLGAMLGTAGGILYLIPRNESTSMQVAVSLMIACVIGTLTGIASLGMEPSKLLLVAMVAIGYAGTDFTMSLIGGG